MRKRSEADTVDFTQFIKEIHTAMQETPIRKEVKEAFQESLISNYDLYRELAK